MVQHADIDHTGITGAGAAAHIADATDAHDASAISFSPAGSIASTDVQAAIEEVASEAAAGSGALPYIRIEDQKTSGTDGGTFTSGAWQTRVLNTEVTDTGNHAALASNQITLAAGTYECRLRAPAGAVDSHQLRLQNVTAGTTLVLGSNEYSGNPAGDFAFTTAHAAGVFTVAGSQALEVQHRCGTTHNTNGFGQSGGWGTEVYAVAEFWKRS